jgi:hydroxypyruvate reductase
MNLDSIQLPNCLNHRCEARAVQRICQAALNAVDPQQAVHDAVRFTGGVLRTLDDSYNLDDFDRVLLISIGKAALPMARAMQNVLGGRITTGLVITKHAGDEKLESLEIIEAGHPLPDQRSQAAAERLIGLLQTATPRDLVLCLLSGGGSALMTSPVPGVTLDDLQQLTRALLACGAGITEINTLRRHLDQVKGGGLLRLGNPGAWLSLILSDVLGSPLESIASGPAAADPTTFADAAAILERYHLRDSISPSIQTALQDGLAGKLPETVKPGDPRLQHVQSTIVGDNAVAAHAALQQAQAEGFHTLLLNEPLQGEASQVGAALGDMLRSALHRECPLPRPVCIVAGGETTVTLRGRGKGGRNQELALGAALQLAGVENAALLTLATDGEDSITGAAGAAVDGSTLQRALQAGLSVEEALHNNDSFTFFSTLGDLLITGPTGTNVNDLFFLFAFEQTL